MRKKNRKSKKTLFKTPIIILIFIALFFLYKLVILRAIAINRVQDFIEDQNADRNNIEITAAAWDPLKSGGYNVVVKIKDDPDREYSYNYKLITNTRKGLKFDYIKLSSVSKNGREDYNPKYGKLENWAIVVWEQVRGV